MSNTQDSPGVQRLVPPYVTAWSSEQLISAELVLKDGCLAYANENADDRDERGVLWYRSPSNRGQGRPNFGRVHPGRQRQAMDGLLCQVCGGPADQTADGVLWLLVRDYEDEWTNWPEGMAADEPPVCRPCARRAIRQCPALRESFAVVRVRRYPIVGVRGALHTPISPSFEPVTHVVMAFSNPAVDWVRASSLLRELHGCTILTTAELLVPQQET